jgi:hypothetical protein
MTLLSPRSKELTYVKKLEWIAQKLIKGNVVFDHSGNPINLSVRSAP